MTAWLLIAAVAVTLILWRAIGVAGAIWRERAHVTAHCAEMDAAAISGAMLCERLPDGTTLLVMPSRGTTGTGPAAGGDFIPTARDQNALAEHEQAAMPQDLYSDAEALFRAVYGDVVRIAHGLLGNRPDAEDIAQNSCCKLMLAWSRIAGPAGTANSAPTWSGS